MNLEAQEDELLVLSSIYEDSFQECTSDSKGGQLVIHLDLPSPISIVGVGNVKNDIKIQYLPPLVLNFSYPEDYPTSRAPDFKLSCKWITRPQLSFLCKELDRLWEENGGDVIVYIWSQHLKDNTLTLLNIGNTLDISEIRPSHMPFPNSSSHSSATSENICDTSNVSHFNAINEVEISIDERTMQDVCPSTNMLLLLRDYDSEMDEKVFSSKTFDCKVCFQEKNGKHCIKFWPCNHVYCKDCMKDYFEVQIKEGNIKLLRCPTDSCKSEANPKQVERLVSRDLYDKWESQLLSITLSALEDTQPCPRIHCQYPVTIEDDQGSCPSCTFVFCALCRAGWHGVEPCRLDSSNLREVMQLYDSNDPKVRKELEAKYGKKQLQKLHTEFLSMNYLKSNAKKCPKCNANIQKIDGCNKMMCQYCGVNFCWVCTHVINSADPYDHFSKVGGTCYYKLFDGLAEQQNNALDIEFDEDDFDDDDDDDFDDDIIRFI